jgi:hypothetical protein
VSWMRSVISHSRNSCCCRWRTALRSPLATYWGTAVVCLVIDVRVPFDPAHPGTVAVESAWLAVRGSSRTMSRIVHLAASGDCNGPPYLAVPGEFALAADIPSIGYFQWLEGWHGGSTIVMSSGVDKWIW